MDAPERPMSFIVRLSWGDAGKATGTVERVASGEKRRFAGIETLPELIAQMSGVTGGSAP
jgi:hypothetical protein